MTIPSVTQPGTGPDRVQAPEDYDAQTTAYRIAFNASVGEMNAAITALNALGITVDADATAVETARQEVVALEAATEGHKDAAEAAADASSANANAIAWVSGGSHTVGDVRWSLLNFASYRAKTTHSGLTTDPRDDTTNWAPVLTLTQATDANFLGNTTFDGAFTEPPHEMTGTVIDPSNGTMQYKVLSATATLTENLAEGQSIMLRIENGDTYAVTWPVDKWTGGSAPALTANDVVVLWQEGGVVFGAYLGSVV